MKYQKVYDCNMNRKYQQINAMQEKKKAQTSEHLIK